MSEPLLKITPEGATVPAVEPTGRWLPIKVAADRADTDVANVRAMILRRGWEAAGLARKVPLPSGQTGWEVDEGADGRFARVKSSEHLTESYRSSREFLALPQAIRDRAIQREQIVHAWLQRLDAGRTLHLAEVDVTKKYVLELKAKGLDASRASLFNWRKELRTTGLRGLVDQWGKREHVDTEQFWRIGSEAWLHPNKRSKQTCFEIAVDQAETHGWEKMSYRDFCRKLDKIPKVVVIKRRLGQDAFVATAEPSIARDYASINANDWWCSDDHTLDVMVQLGFKEDGSPQYGRPYLHAWQDLRSRRIIAWQLLPAAPRATDVLRTFVNAVREHGRPANVLVDNGKHFDARSLQGVTKHRRLRGHRPEHLTPAELARVGGAMNVLGCKVHHALPHHGQSKPIERAFGTVCGRFSKLFEAYTGNSTTNKPGRGNGTTATQKALDRGDVLTLEEMTQAFAQWVADDYNARPHTGDAMDGRTPDQVYTETLATVHRVSDEILEFATFERFGPVKIHKNGVTWNGLQFGWSLDPLIRRLGEQVMLAIDERCVSHVYVLDLNGGLICRAQSNEKLPFNATKDVVKAAHKEKRRANRIEADYHEARPRMQLDVAAMAFDVSAKKRRKLEAAQRAAGPVLPPSVQAVRTPFDAQSEAIRDAMRSPAESLRIAASDAPVAAGGFVYTSAASAADDEPEDHLTLGFTYGTTPAEDTHE